MHAAQAAQRLWDDDMHWSRISQGAESRSLPAASRRLRFHARVSGRTGLQTRTCQFLSTPPTATPVPKISALVRKSLLSWAADHPAAPRLAVGALLNDLLLFAGSLRHGLCVRTFCATCFFGCVARA